MNWCSDCSLNLNAVIRPDGSQAKRCAQADLDDIRLDFPDDDDADWIVLFRKCHKRRSTGRADLFGNPL